MNYKKQEGKTIFLKEKNIIHQIQVSDIIYIKADTYISTIYLNNFKKSIVLSLNLKVIHKELSIYSFIRIHRKILINLRYLSCIKKEKIYIAFLNYDIKLHFSRRKWKKFKELKLF